MDDLIDKLVAQYPEIKFIPSKKQTYWSPKNRTIYYKIKASIPETKWAILHELGHAQLDHTHYQNDFSLLKMEVSAWEEAKILAKSFKEKINEDYIQDCLDTYRDWLYKRSICPVCFTNSHQNSDGDTYSCFNCRFNWKVSGSRFCRPYRTKEPIA